MDARWLRRVLGALGTSRGFAVVGGGSVYVETPALSLWVDDCASGGSMCVPLTDLRCALSVFTGDVEISTDARAVTVRDPVCGVSIAAVSTPRAAARSHPVETAELLPAVVRDIKWVARAAAGVQTGSDLACVHVEADGVAATDARRVHFARCPSLGLPAGTVIPVRALRVALAAARGSLSASARDGALALGGPGWIVSSPLRSLHFPAWRPIATAEVAHAVRFDASEIQTLLRRIWRIAGARGVRVHVSADGTLVADGQSKSGDVTVRGAIPAGATGSLSDQVFNPAFLLDILDGARGPATLEWGSGSGPRRVAVGNRVGLFAPYLGNSRERATP